MNRRQLGLGVATAAMTLGSAARAQQVFVQRGPEATAFYNSFNDQISRLPETQQADVRAFYEMNGWRPVWNADRVRALNTVAAGANRHGLAGSDYFDFVGLAADPASADLRTTAAALAYARVLAEGKVRPETVEDLWEMQKNRVDLPRGLSDALSRKVLGQWYDGLAPTDIGYQNLSAGYVRYRRLAAQGGWPRFTQGATIEPGNSDRRIPALIDRLTAEGDLSAADGARLKSQGLVYNAELQRAVQSFQNRHGLGADGRIGAGTQRSLGASAEDRARQIALNLERRRWLKREVAPERIEVNTAAAIMVYWKDAKPVHSNRVVVGSARQPDAQPGEALRLGRGQPALVCPRRHRPARDPAQRAPAIWPPTTCMCRTARSSSAPARSSALGYVKFELRDSYAIFLHDTPSKAAFNLSTRQRSHGCVRVQNAVEFARLLLSPDPTKLAQFDTAQDTRETTRVTTGREISVRLLYWTAFVDGQGRVAFREDVYGRDDKLAQALGIGVNLPKPIDDGRADANDVGP